MTNTPQDGGRKKLRVGHVSERGGVNAVRTLLEAHRLVVDEISGRNDYGRDLNVDLTEDGEITGVVIGVQVKGDRRFIRPGDWALPATPKDRRFWADSSIPIVGVLWDPDSEELRWANLSEFARTDPGASTWPPGRATDTSDALATVRFPTVQRLDSHTLPVMVTEMLRYVRRTGSTTFLRLFDPDDEQRCNAVDDCWAVGRTDARAFLLLRRALPGLKGESLRLAIVALSHLTPHPDIMWHSGNWIPPEIEREVHATFQWTPQEVHHLVQAVEELGGVWERGGLGQCVWSLLIMDRNLRSTVLPALELALAADHLDAGFRLLIIHQYLTREDPAVEVRQVLTTHPRLKDHHLAAELLPLIEEYGRLDVY